MADKPKVNSAAEKELDKIDKDFKAFDENVQSLTMDRMNESPKVETAPQVERSQQELNKAKEIYLKPVKTIGCGPKDKFNEKFREAYNYDKTYVEFEAENHEVIGETIDVWTRPYGGMPAEEWKVPTNKPVWGPRYLAEQIKRCSYHRLKMEQTVTETVGVGSMYGQLTSDSVVQRLDAKPVVRKSHVFMGARNF